MTISEMWNTTQNHDDDSFPAALFHSLQQRQPQTSKLFAPTELRKGLFSFVSWTWLEKWFPVRFPDPPLQSLPRGSTRGPRWSTAEAKGRSEGIADRPVVGVDQEGQSIHQYASASFHWWPSSSPVSSPGEHWSFLLMVLRTSQVVSPRIPLRYASERTTNKLAWQSSIYDPPDTHTRPRWGSFS